MNFFKIISITVFCFLSFSSQANDLNNELINKISKNIRCIVCQGQSVYDSQSDFALSIKLVINKKIEEGFTEDQIYKFLSKKYGDWILYDPQFNKNTYLLWFLPLLIFLFGGAIILKKLINIKK